MTALSDWDIVGDAELAGAAAAGDRRAFAEIYDRYADRLHDFCVGMVRDRDTAADCVQDVFCTAATRLPQLRERAKLRPWLYSIARHEALRQIRARTREQVSEEVPDAASAEPGPDTLAARLELADLIDEAAGGLSDRDQAVLELAYRQGLDGPELAEALGVSQSNANTMVHRLRHTIQRSLGALLVARHVQRNPDVCPDLATILAGWDGKLTKLMRKRIARHTESCPECEEDRRQRVSPTALLGAAPVFIPAPERLRHATLENIELTAGAAPTPSESGLAAPDGAAGTAGSAPTPPGQRVAADGGTNRGRHLAAATAVVVATLLASLALTMVWLRTQGTPITPTDLPGTIPSPAPAAPAPPVAPAPAPPVEIEPPPPTRPAQSPAPGATPAPTVAPGTPAAPPRVAPAPTVTPEAVAPEPVPPPAVAPPIPTLPSPVFTPPPITTFELPPEWMPTIPDTAPTPIPRQAVTPTSPATATELPPTSAPTAPESTAPSVPRIAPLPLPTLTWPDLVN